MSRWYTVRDVSGGLPEDNVHAPNAAIAAETAVAGRLNECDHDEATTDVVEVDIRPHDESAPPLRARVKPVYVGWRAEVVS